MQLNTHTSLSFKNSPKTPNKEIFKRINPEGQEDGKRGEEMRGVDVLEAGEQRGKW